MLDLEPLFELVSRRVLGVPGFGRAPDRYASERLPRPHALRVQGLGV